MRPLDPATYIGRGKAEELRRISEAVDADTVVFDDELTPAQQRNLERILGRTAIDRTAVILDIFAQNAHTQEGRAQVELALSRYRLPRLRGHGPRALPAGRWDRDEGPGRDTARGRPPADHAPHPQARGRAPGSRVRRAAPSARRESEGRCGRCRSSATPTPASPALLNVFTDAGVLVEDKLFSTLDPRTRRLDLPGGESVLCSDTVGFVRKLPHQLVDAFHATLEVVGSSDLLVHVVDAFAADPPAQIDAVRAVLTEIGAGEVPELLAFNKADLDRRKAGRLMAAHPGSVACSALTGRGVPELLRRHRGPAQDRGSRWWSSPCPWHAATSSRRSIAKARSSASATRASSVLVTARLDERGARRYAEFVLE